MQFRNDQGRPHSEIILNGDGPVQVVPARTRLDGTTTHGQIFDAQTGRLIHRPTPRDLENRRVFTVLDGCSSIQRLTQTADGRWIPKDRMPLKLSGLADNTDDVTTPALPALCR